MLNEMTESLNTGSWFALQVRPRAEKFVASMLRYNGYEEFLPTYRARHRWSDRVKDVTRPLFPGYLFVRFSAPAGCLVVTTPGIIRIVGCGGRPVAVADEEITALQSLVRAGVAVEPCTFIQTGQRVRIMTGPLSGTSGVVQRIKNSIRLVISVDLLQRSVAAEVDVAWVAAEEPVPARR